MCVTHGNAVILASTQQCLLVKMLLSTSIDWLVVHVPIPAWKEVCTHQDAAVCGYFA